MCIGLFATEKYKYPLVDTDWQNPAMNWQVYFNTRCLPAKLTGSNPNHLPYTFCKETSRYHFILPVMVLDTNTASIFLIGITINGTKADRDYLLSLNTRVSTYARLKR